MVHVTGDLMSNPTIAEVLQRAKPKYPLCYCKVCQGDTQRAQCPNKHNPTARADSIWFKALRGEPIPPVKGG